MSVLSEEKVLRINCPGFGVSSTLPLGEAKPLAMYDVIVANPSSILHLFGTNTDIQRQIEALQNDGMTSYRADDDSVVDAVTAEMDLRKSELLQFIKKGGLLIVFLAPPFTVQGATSSMDNYTWLGEWVPDKVSGPNQRNMSATIRGKAVDVCDDDEAQLWAPYLRQAGVEWSTIIRVENLADGFAPVALAGPNKCIAAVRKTGNKNGRILLLPAPYEPSLDDQLKHCILSWYERSLADDGGSSSAMAQLSDTLSSLLSDPEPAPVAPPEMELPRPGESVREPIAEHDTPHAERREPEVAEQHQFEPQPAEVPSTREVLEVQEVQEVQEVHAVRTEIEHEMPEKPEFFDFPTESNNVNNNHDADGMDKPAVPEAKELIRKMEQEINKPAVPEWCQKYSFNELDGLRQQLCDLEEEMRLAQLKAADLIGRIEMMEDLKNALLSAQGDHLHTACAKIFELLGWQVKPAIGSSEEFWLMQDDKTQAIVRIVYTQSQPSRADLAALAESVITYWGAHEIEPKGILVASTWADRPPQDRKDEDYPESMNDFAKRKNLGLLTTAQLLSIYRDLTVKGVEPREIREIVLTTSGLVPGFRFEATKGKPAAVK